MNEPETGAPGPDASAPASLDDWGAAMAEQAAAKSANPPQPSAASASGAAVFPNLQAGATPPLGATDLERILDVPVRLTAELGRTRITIKTLLQLAPGSVLELDGLAGEPMDLFVNDYLIAQGEVVVVNDRYGIRVTDIITPSERMQKLNGR